MENLDRHIRYFLKVAELSSLSQAAEALDRTQSGLSRQLAALESFLGKPLFIRTGRGMTLTDAGEKLRKGVFIPYQLIDDAVGLVKDKEGVTEGSLRIATIHTLSYYFVSDLLAKFMGLHGQVNLAIMARSSPEVVELVEKGKADLGFVYDSAVASEALESVPLFDDAMCLIVRQGDFDGAESLDLTKQKVPLIGFPEHYALRRMLKHSNLNDNVVAEANTIDAMLQLVSLGLGSCILPQRIPGALLAEYHLVKVTLVAPLLKRRVVAIVRKNVGSSSLAGQLLDMAKNVVS